MAIHYAATNQYASESDIGFANTWIVVAFHSRKARDSFVSEATDIATKAIKRREIGRYIARPKPFTGRYWAIDSTPIWPDVLMGRKPQPHGYLGYVYSRVPDSAAMRRVYP